MGIWGKDKIRPTERRSRRVNKKSLRHEHLYLRPLYVHREARSVLMRHFFAYCLLIACPVALVSVHYLYESLSIYLGLEWLTKELNVAIQYSLASLIFFLIMLLCSFKPGLLYPERKIKNHIFYWYAVVWSLGLIISFSYLLGVSLNLRYITSMDHIFNLALRYTIAVAVSSFLIMAFYFGHTQAYLSSQQNLWGMVGAVIAGFVIFLMISLIFFILDQGMSPFRLVLNSVLILPALAFFIFIFRSAYQLLRAWLYFNELADEFQLYDELKTKSDQKAVESLGKMLS